MDNQPAPNQTPSYSPPPRPPTAAQKFERNGWLGLILTLAICLAAFVLYLIFHKTAPAPPLP